MRCVLRPVIAGEQPPGLGIDVVAVEPDERPFLDRHAYAVQVRLGEAEIAEFAHGVRLQIDANTERAHIADRFEYDAGNANLVQR